MDRVTGLPAKGQNPLAHRLSAELDAEARWHRSFECSQPELATLARKALAERRQGKTKAMDCAHGV
jgi:hypothetical protein